nr:hypothetical protein [Tanacetum cinerariifolium]
MKEVKRDRNNPGVRHLNFVLKKDNYMPTSNVDSVDVGTNDSGVDYEDGNFLGNKPSFASVFHKESSKKKVNFHTLITDNTDVANVLIPISSILEVHARFKNTLYGYFLRKKVVFPCYVNREDVDSKFCVDKRGAYVCSSLIKFHGVPTLVFTTDGLSAIVTPQKSDSCGSFTAVCDNALTAVCDIDSHCDDSLAVEEKTILETLLNISPENKAHYDLEKEAIHLLLTGIGDEIYLTIDACKTTHEMWIAIERLQQEYSRSETIVKQTVDLDKESYHKLFDILKQYQKEVNEIHAKKISRNTNPLTLVTATQQYPNTYYQASKSHKSYAPPSKQSSSTRSHRDTDMQKNLALIVKYFKKIYKPTDNNLKTSTTRNKNVDTSPRHFAKECRKPKRGKDYTYHKEKMLLCKQAKKSVSLQADQADWLEDTDEEVDKQELEAHYMYMEKIQEVHTSDSEPSFDAEPLEKRSNTLYNAIMEAGGKDRPPMLAPDKDVLVTEGSFETTTERYMENYKNVSQDICDQLNAEAEAIQIVLTWIDNDSYSAVDACPNACKMCKDIESKECQKPKRAKDAGYHKEKMLLCKQEEAGFQLNAEQADWRDDTDDESKDLELEAHYMYMVQIQEVNHVAADNSRPIFDSEPLQKVSNNDNYNVFTIESEHPEQSKSINDIYLIEQDEHNMIIDSLDISYDREHIDHDDDDLANESDLLASLIEK